MLGNISRALLSGLMVASLALWPMPAFAKHCPRKTDEDYVKNDCLDATSAMHKNPLAPILAALGGAALARRRRRRVGGGGATDDARRRAPSGLDDVRGRVPTKPAPPALIDPDTGERLIHHDGTYEEGEIGDVWYDGQWVDPATAARWIQEREAEIAAREREVERFWDETQRASEKRARERIDRLQREGFVYDPDTDAWRPGPNHSEFKERLIRERIRKTDQAIDSIMQRLPMGEWGAIEELREKLTEPGSPNAETLDRLERLREAVFNKAVGHTEMEAAEAELDAGWAGLGEDAGTSVRHGAIAAGVATMFAPGAAAASAQLGAMFVGSNFIEGATEGYVEGGSREALVRGVRYALPVNTGIAIYEGEGAGQIGISVLQDLGNAATLLDGVRGLSKLVKGATKQPSRAFGRVSGKVDEAAEAATRARSADPVEQIDADWLAGKKRGEQLLNQFEDTHARLKKATSPAQREALQKQLQQQAIEINSSYQAKAIFKAQRQSRLSQAFDDEIQRVYNEVDALAAKKLTDMGIQRGGRDFQPRDMYDIRNASSAGTVGMDRDLALNEKYVRAVRARLEKATPGSRQAQRLTRRLQRAEARSQLTRHGKRLSTSDWNREAQRAYDEAYEEVTRRLLGTRQGKSAEQAFQAVTQSKNPEAYRDLAVLRNEPYETPFKQEWAEQTASVSSYKTFLNQDLADKGLITQGDAIQETARGLAKDMKTKLEPLMRSDMRLPVAKHERMMAMRQFLERVGQGKIPPGQSTQQFKQQFGVSLERGIEQITANLEAAIKYRQPAAWIR